MRARLRLLALLKEVVGSEELVVELDCEHATVEQVLREASKRNHRLSEALALLERHGVKPLVMVNGVVVNYQHEVEDGDEVALMPPASGG